MAIKFLFRCMCVAVVLAAGDRGLCAKEPLKIYIETDLEGASGVYKFSQTREKDSPLNLAACRYLMDDIAAVVRGLREAGVEKIVVLDGHGNQTFIPDLMVPGAAYITGLPRPGGPESGLDASYSGFILLGLHAMMGTPDGVLCHTQSSRSESRYWYNGVETGEIGQSAAIAGHFGVPTIMVTGSNGGPAPGQGGYELHTGLHLLSDDVRLYLRAMYNTYAVEIMPAKGYIFSECPFGKYASDKTFEEAAFLERVRMMLVMEEGQSLWLARATPRACY